MVKGINDKISVVDRFNQREKNAFEEVYVLMFDEIRHYACRLFYYTDVDAKDLLQDLFVSIWSNKSLKFFSIEHIKNYLYLGVKNKFKDYLKHNKHVRDYRGNVINSEEYDFTARVESGTLAILSEATTALPAEYAEIFRLYLEGWDTNEIAAKMNISQSSVYNKRNEAIVMLKKTLNNRQLEFILLFLLK